MPIVEIEDSEGNSNEVEVPKDNIRVKDDEDIILKSQDDYNSMIQSRLDRKESSLKTDLKKDDEFFQEAASKRGIELREDGKPKGSVKDEEYKELKKKASKVDSLQSKVDEYEETRQQTRETKLENNLLQSTEGFKNEQAKKSFIREAKSQMEYDEEYGWHRTDENGDPIYKAGEPVGYEGVVDNLRDSHSFYFQSTEMKGGPEDEAGTKGPAGKTLTQSQYKSELESARKSNNSERIRELRKKAAQDKVIE